MTDVKIEGADVEPVEGEVITAAEAARLQRLGEISAEIQEEISRGRHFLGESIEIYFAIGRKLLEARNLMQSNQEFGGWCRDQGFTWSRQWLHILRKLAENEEKVKAALSSQVDNAQREGLPLSINVKKALSDVLSGNGKAAAELPLVEAEAMGDGAGEPVEATVTLWQSPWTMNAERGQVTFAHRRKTKEWRKAWKALAQENKLPKFRTAVITATTVQKNRSAMADAGANYPAVKAAIDGLVDAGVLPGDGPDVVSTIVLRAPLVDDGAPRARGLRISLEGIGR